MKNWTWKGSPPVRAENRRDRVPCLCRQSCQSEWMPFARTMRAVGLNNTWPSQANHPSWPHPLNTESFQIIANPSFPHPGAAKEAKSLCNDQLTLKTASVWQFKLRWEGEGWENLIRKMMDDTREETLEWKGGKMEKWLCGCGNEKWSRGIGKTEMPGNSREKVKSNCSSRTEVKRENCEGRNSKGVGKLESKEGLTKDNKEQEFRNEVMEVKHGSRVQGWAQGE